MEFLRIIAEQKLKVDSWPNPIPFLKIPKRYKLNYMGGTSCSAGYSHSEVYFNFEGKKYVVVSVNNYCHYMGDSEDHSVFYSKLCEDLVDVFQELLNFCGYDGNEAENILENFIQSP